MNFGAVQVLIGTVPDQPKKAEFVIANLGDFSITVTFIEPAYTGGIPIVKYELWIDDGAGVWPVTPIYYTPLVPGATYTYKFTGLTAGGNYQIKIVAVNLVGSSVASEVSYFQCADISDAPSTPILESTTPTSISVAWNEPLSDGGSPISGYRLYMNDILADDVFRMVFDGANYPSTLTYTATGLIPGRYYRFKATALNKIGESDPSTEATFLAADFPSAPSQPYLIWSTSTQVKFGWYPPSDNGGGQIIGYQVYHKLKSEDELAWSLIGATDLNTLTYQHNGLSVIEDA